MASNVSAKLTFLKFLDKSKLPAEFVRDVEAYRTFSSAFKINIACEALPQYTAFDAQACGFAYPTYTHIGPTIEYLERAYDDAKYGDMSREPFITPVTPSFVDDTIAPPGKHVVHLFGGHAPYTLKEGDWTTRKDELVRKVLRVMDEHAPGFSSGVIDMQVLTPPDIEAKIGSPHGHIFHGELQIDQLFWARPAPHWADYRTPIKGLYQCGSSAHPGGGVGGVVGHNAAREISSGPPPVSAAAGRGSYVAGGAPPRTRRIGVRCIAAGRFPLIHAHGACTISAPQGMRELALVWAINSETGVLTDVLLCAPEFYKWIETNAIAIETLGSGRQIDAQRLQNEYRQLEDALDHAGVRRHYIEPEPHLHYQVYTRELEPDHSMGSGADATRAARSAWRDRLNPAISWGERRLLAILQQGQYRGWRYPYHSARVAPRRLVGRPHVERRRDAIRRLV